MDKELLAAIGQMIDEKLKPVHQSITGMHQDITGMQQDITGMQQDIADVKQEVVKTNLKLETDITKRLDSLTDGYILNHEKQHDLERQLTDLQRRVEALEIKVS
ncbi:hypothetical protein SAMN02745823_03083 [Sporobacter termitidis DSM 10068]|uniref:Uncharacterized protein n=1 Tax=Sporobacter termitidis DSM 10068 TaxID=1123282 RepID=A0A1M5Z1A4_9FIRM|nr:hypothetical protein [Sporobacter termitidis]SHI18019.1 hypothetical protein SAMN02745823_03083 [Sporobacter termitidis DSM 10068]